MRVPFHRPSVGGHATQLIADVLNSGWITSGPMTERLESMVRELTGARHAVAVNSATTGMMLCMRFVGADFWYVPAFGGHFYANAVKFSGGSVALLLDCGDDLTTGSSMDFGGRACRARHGKSGCFTLCDSAYSLGGIGRDGKPIGTQADAHVFSLQATKQITCGEGGIITTDIDELAAWLKRARCHGMDADSHTRKRHGYDIVQPGGAFLLSDILAAVAVAQMETFEERHTRRNNIRVRYHEMIGRCGYFACDEAHGLHVLRVPKRDEFIAKMAERGVSCKVHYPLISDLTAWKHLDTRDCPNAKKAASEVASLPLYSSMTDEEVEYVCTAARETLAELEA